jgi:hypothetical protein
MPGLRGIYPILARSRWMSGSLAHSRTESAHELSKRKHAFQALIFLFFSILLYII